MKLLYITIEYKPMVGGGASFTKDLCKYLAKQKNLELLLVTSGEQDNIEYEDGYTIHRYKTLHDFWHSKLDLNLALENIANSIETFKPDIIHSIHQNATLLTEIVNQNYKIPLIITHHRTPQFNRGKTVKNGKELLFDFTNIFNENHFIAPTKTYIKALFESIKRLDEKQISLVYPGVDEEFYNKSNTTPETINNIKNKLEIKADDKVILLPMRLRNRKGLGFLANSLSTYTKHQLKIILTGYPEDASEEKIREDFEAKIKNIHTLVPKYQYSNEDMLNLYQICNFMILPSEGEGYGCVLLEALSIGCPIIATNVSGINEVIKPGLNGQLIEYGNTDQLKDAIYKYITDDNFRNQTIINCYKVQKEMFDPNIWSKNHINIYKQIITDTEIKINSLAYIVSNNKIEIILNEKQEFILEKKLNPGYQLSVQAAKILEENYKINIEKRADFTLSNREYVFAFELNERPINSTSISLEKLLANKSLSSLERKALKNLLISHSATYICKNQ